jgi:MSHA biogenesis protein MshN
MSLINKVLQDLEGRSALAANGVLPPPHVRPLDTAHPYGRWIRILVGLFVIVALARVSWTVYEVQPRGAFATERTAHAAAVRAPVPVQIAVPKPPVVEPAPAPEAITAPLEPPQAAPSIVVAQPLKLALAIETPPPEERPRARAERKKAPIRRADPEERKAESVAKRSEPESIVIPGAVAGAPPASVQKSERARSPAEQAESQFAHAMALLREGRSSEAEAGLASALATDPRHKPARQALVSLLLEQRRLADAVPVLKAGLQLDPDQAQFAFVLARIQADRQDYTGALETLGAVRSSTAASGDFNNLFAVVLQRLSRHREAIERYRVALQAAPANGASWMGLAISLEALGEREDATDAYRRAMASGTLSADARTYVDQKIRELR